MVLGVYATYKLVFHRCLLWTCAPARSFLIADLALPYDLFPANAYGSAFGPHRDSLGALETAYMTVFWREGNTTYTSIYNVYRFGSEFQATRFLQRSLQDNTFIDKSNIQFQSSIADEYSAGCGYSIFGGGYSCMFRGRYEEFVISFFMTPSKGMSFNEFEQAIIFIDEQMKQYLATAP